MPDIHSGYGFAVGNVAAFDMANPDSIVSPGGVGFDINCGVRLLRSGRNTASLHVSCYSCHCTIVLFCPCHVGSIDDAYSKHFHAAVACSL